MFPLFPTLFIGPDVKPWVVNKYFKGPSIFLTLSEHSHFRSPNLSINMSSDLILAYRLPTAFTADYIEHQLGGEEAARTRWCFGREIGRGGFGVVHLQTEQRSGQLRAVKTITKATIPAGLDYRRELLTMAMLAKVSRTPRVAS